MIVPMKKVSFVILEKEREKSLQALRKAGMVHLMPLSGAGDDLAAAKAKLADVERALSLMEGSAMPKDAKKVQKSLKKDETAAKVDEILAIFDSKKAAEDEIVKGERELERFSAWGDVNPADFAELAAKGINLSMFELPIEAQQKIGDDAKVIVAGADKNVVRVLTVSKTTERPSMPSEAIFVPLPEKSLAEIRGDISAAKKKIAESTAAIQKNAPFLDAMSSLKKSLEKDVEFENVKSGMEAEGELAWLTGFVPAPDLPKVAEVAKKNSWAFVASDPTDEDKGTVPTKLKNSKPVQILYPVLDFLGTVPGYKEFDITAWFLFFFTIFFAMIFGDAGYGTLLLLISFVMAAKTKAKGEKLSLVNQLLMLISAATIVWGALNCTWFGIDYNLLPEVFHKMTLPQFSPANPESATNVQIFCFMLALAQLSVGHFTALFRNIKEKSLKLLADLGSLSIVWGMFFVVLNLLISAERFPISQTILAMIGGGFAASFVFSNYEGSIGGSILESCKNIISVLLGLVNFFSDIVSYIRLWAVGLAGAAIAQTVNQMVGPMLGSFLIFAGVLLLVFGHGLNMILNVLSVIVHGVRLNTLEFTSHVGMAWTGFKYAPFAEENAE